MCHQIYFLLQSFRSRRISAAQQGENRAGSCSNTRSFLLLLSAENARADGRRWRTQAAGASPDAALAKLPWAQMARPSASTRDTTTQTCKSPDSRRHTSARSSAQPRGLKCARTQRPHQIGHEIKCYIKSALIPDPFNPVVAALRDQNKNSNCVHSSARLCLCVAATREAEAPRPTTLPPFPPYLRSPALQMKAQSSRSNSGTGQV